MPVPNELHPNARIALVGEAPGADEEREGRPFVGRAGQCQMGILRELGLTRTDCSWYNIMTTRPKNNNFGQFYQDTKRKLPSADLKDAWRRLEWELADNQDINIVVPLGAEPLRAVTSHTTISKWRGSCIQVELNGSAGKRRLKVLPTFHPSYLIRGGWGDRPIAVLDMLKALQQSEFPEYRYNPPTHRRIEDPILATQALLRLAQTPYDPVAFDIETNGSLITDIGFANSRESFTFQLYWGEPLYAPEVEVIFWRAIALLLGNRKVPKIIQNYQFDALVLLESMAIPTRGIVDDTMIMHHCIYPEMPKSLDFLTSI